MSLSLADAIMAGDMDHLHFLLSRGIDINQIDEYGFTYLIEAAIADNFAIAKLLIDYGANVNLQDPTGGTPLHWAAENNNLALCQLLLANKANPNAYNFSGQPVLTMPILRRQSQLRKLFLSYGVDLDFVKDFINTKLLGHMFELVGTANLVTPDNQFIEMDFEGFFLEFSIGVITDSVKQFRNHFAARKLRRFHPLIDAIIRALNRGAELIRFLQYRTDLSLHQTEINHLLQEEPLVIPIGYEGHAITFIKFGNLFAKCDRREDSRLYDNIVIYRIHRPDLVNLNFLKSFIYDKKSDHFVNVELAALLGLEPLMEIKIEAQISGNCSWANVEATLPTLFFLLLLPSLTDEKNIGQYKSLAMDFFKQWRDWNRERALRFCVSSFRQDDPIRNACKAEILGAILFQSCRVDNFKDHERIELILSILSQPSYSHILDNYVKIYYYESFSPEGKDFVHLLKQFGYLS